MRRPVDHDEVVGLFYESVLDESRWTEALSALCEFVGGDGYGYVTADPRRQQVTSCQSWDVDPAFDQLYLDYYATKEVRLPGAARVPVGQVMTEAMLLERRELERSEIYNDLLVPYDAPHFMIAWVRKLEDSLHTVAIEGTRRHGAFEADAQARFGRILPHLVRTVQLSDTLAETRAARSSYRQALDALPVAALFVNRDGRIVELTARAERLLRRSQGLSLREGKVQAANLADDRRLQHALNLALGTPAAPGVAQSTLLVRRSRGAAALLVTVLPVRAPNRPLPLTACAALLITDPDEQFRTDAARIQRAFRLTESEAAVVQALYAGLSLVEASKRLRRSLNTTKTQLKSIYGKTGCHNRADLMRLILSVMHAPQGGSPDP